MPRFTAATQYGAVGLGAGRFAGPEFSTEVNGAGARRAGDSPVPAPQVANGRNGRNGRVTPVDDPLFWLVAAIGAVVGLASVAAR